MPQSIPVLFEDPYILVAEKPPGMPSQKDKTGDEDLLSLVFGQSGAAPGPVHRLDRPVGGLVIVARTAEAAARFSELFRGDGMKKEYLAVIHGAMEAPGGELRHFLAKNGKTNTSRAVPEGHKLGKLAVLDYSTLARAEKYSLVQVNLRTGRHHQIRVQFNETGHPLYGDQKYGRGFGRGGQKLALWSYRLSFQHPFTGKDMAFSSLPDWGQFPWLLFPPLKDMSS